LLEAHQICGDVVASIYTFPCKATKSPGRCAERIFASAPVARRCSAQLLGTCKYSWGLSLILPVYKLSSPDLRAACQFRYSKHQSGLLRESLCCRAQVHNRLNVVVDEMEALRKTPRKEYHS
jgi:hypothetical protein